MKKIKGLEFYDSFRKIKKVISKLDTDKAFKKLDDGEQGERVMFELLSKSNKLSLDEFEEWLDELDDDEYVEMLFFVSDRMKSLTEKITEYTEKQ